MKFSICIPNYNYANYLDKTVRSVLDQTYADFEILVSDNASTDASVQVVESFGDPRIHVRINPCNVGFAGNLDRAAGMAEGDRMVLLSSDDLIDKEALATYHKLCGLLPHQGAKAIISSGEYIIDSQGKTTSRLGVYGPPFLLPEDRVPELEREMGAPVYRVAAGVLLKRCVLAMQNPFHFATTCYPRALYQLAGGYGGARLYNPDKWFHWRLLAVADDAYYIDRPLFSYRWHTSNQASQEKRSGVLKFLTDEYLNSIELPNEVLSAIGLTRADVERAFVKHDIAQHGLAVLAKQNASEARRILRFGQAVYPQQTSRNRKAQLLRLALPFGYASHRLARMAYGMRAKQVRSHVDLPPSDDAQVPVSASSN
jgi:glycosyltransferase involved in cell wall biosynthesis